MSCWMKSSYKLDEIGSSWWILLLQAPKPNCFLSPIPCIQISNYQDFLHWKINTKDQLAAETKSRFFRHKNKVNFCSQRLRNGARSTRENIIHRNLRPMYPSLRQKWSLVQTIPSKILYRKTALCSVSFVPCMIAKVIPLPAKFVVATNLPVFKDNIQISILPLGS